jgi:hypothetical protein
MFSEDHPELRQPWFREDPSWNVRAARNFAEHVADPLARLWHRWLARPFGRLWRYLRWWERLMYGAFALFALWLLFVVVPQLPRAGRP